jgi:uncharacterized protein with von Willebrand factor type A (vWA) domain
MDDRAYSLGIFGDIYDSISWVRDTDDLDKHIEWSGSAPGGGTDFNKALTHAMDEIEEMKKFGQEGVDLLFVTDGHAYLADETKERWFKLQEETNSRLFYVGIGGGINDDVKEFSDATYAIGSNLSQSKDSEKLTIEVLKEIMQRRAM